MTTERILLNLHLPDSEWFGLYHEVFPFHETKSERGPHEPSWAYYARIGREARLAAIRTLANRIDGVQQ